MGIKRYRSGAGAASRFPSSKQQMWAEYMARRVAYAALLTARQVINSATNHDEFQEAMNEVKAELQRLCDLSGLPYMEDPINGKWEQGLDEIYDRIVSEMDEHDPF